MPQTKSAAKALRHSARRRVINDRWRVKVRSSIRAVRDALGNNDAAAAEAAYATAQKTIDRATRRNVIHRTAAARKKSRLSRAIKQLKG